MSSVVMKLEPGPETPPSTAVIEAIAEHAGQDPMDLEPRLYEVIDPDALDVLVGTDDSGRRPAKTAVQFTFADYRVSVSGDGSVEVSASRSG